MARTKRRFPLAVAFLVAVAAVGGGATWLVQRGTFSTEGALVPGAVNPGQPLSASSSASSSATSAASSAGAGAPAVPSPAQPTLVTAPAPGQVVATDPPPPSGGTQVQILVTYAGYDPASAGIEVDGFVSGVVESGGICRLTVTEGAVTLSAQAAATPNASTTACGDVRVVDPRLTSGQWRAVLSYASSTSTGSSAPLPVQVP